MAWQWVALWLGFGGLAGLAGSTIAVDEPIAMLFGFGAIVGAVQHGYLRRVPLTRPLWILNSTVGWIISLAPTVALVYLMILFIDPAYLPFNSDSCVFSTPAALLWALFGFLQTRFSSSAPKIPFWWLTCGAAGALMACASGWLDQTDLAIVHAFSPPETRPRSQNDPALAVMQGIAAGFIFGLMTAIHLKLVVLFHAVPSGSEQLVRPHDSAAE